MSDPNRYERALASDAFEHDDTAGPKVKRVGNYIYNTDTLEWEKWDGIVDSAGFSKDADITITKTVAGNVTTFVKTDGVKTQTITIYKDTNITTKVWS